MLVVEVDHAEHLVGTLGETQSQVGPRRVRIRQGRAACMTALEDLERGRDDLRLPGKLG